jgi:hypothetical protein
VANILTGGVLIFDTAGATSAVTHAVGIQSVKWEGAGAADDAVVLHDAAGGKVVFEDTAPGKNLGAYLSFAHAIHVRGLYLTTLASGKLYVYLSGHYGG